MKQLSIVICTYNRSRQLLKLIACLDNDVKFPNDLIIEVIIVDNNSTDLTSSLTKKLLKKARPYQLRYVIETKSGLSNARNRGIRESKYNWICFLDDDILLERKFFEALKSANIEQLNIRCNALKVVNSQINKPKWYRTDGKYCMLNRGNYNLGDKSRFLRKDDPLPIGTGMIIHKSIFERIGTFDIRFGYDATKSILIPGEETEFFLKIIQDGVPIYYIHNAIVNHYPEEKKYEINNICRTYKGIGYWYGRKDALNSKNRITITYAGFPGAYYKRLFLLTIPYLISRLQFNSTIRNFYLFEMNHIIGRFLGYKAFR